MSHISAETNISLYRKWRRVQKGEPCKIQTKNSNFSIIRNLYGVSCLTWLFILSDELMQKSSIKMTPLQKRLFMLTTFYNNNNIYLLRQVIICQQGLTITRFMIKTNKQTNKLTHMGNMRKLHFLFIHQKKKQKKTAEQEKRGKLLLFIYT